MKLVMIAVSLLSVSNTLIFYNIVLINGQKSKSGSKSSFYSRIVVKFDRESAF